METEQRNNIMGTMPVNELVLTMSWPVMLSMLLQAVYNLWDSICVAQVSDDAFLALSLAYPVQMLMIAVCVGTGVGFNAVLAKKLGEGKLEEAGRVACHGYFLYLCNWVVFLLFGLLGSRLFFSLSIDDPEVIRDGVQYLSICCCLSLGMCMQFVTERVLQCSGKPMGFMIIQGSGALINMVLDPVFIFLLDMGVVGAAVATVIGQISGALIGFWLVWRNRDHFPIRLRGFRPEKDIIAPIYRIGAPGIVMQSVSSFMSLGMNQLLIRWSEMAVWVIGVYFKVQSFVFMPVFGLNNGLIPVISYNYGARSRERITRSIRFGMKLGLAILAAGTVLLWVFPGVLLKYCFNASPEAMDMGTFALRVIACSFLFAGVSILSSSVFQPLGYSRYSLWVTLLRQLVLLLPLAVVFLALRPEWVWWAFPITEAAVMLVTIALYRKVHRETIEKIS